MVNRSNKKLNAYVDDIRIRRKQHYVHILKTIDILAEFLESAEKREFGEEMQLGMYYMAVELIHDYVFTVFGRDVGVDTKRYESRYIMQKLLELAKEDLAKKRAREAQDERKNG